MPNFSRLFAWLPMTPLGLATGTGVYIALRFWAYDKLDLVFLVLGLVLATLLGLCLLLVAITTWILKWRLKHVHTSGNVHTESQRWTPTHFRVPSLQWLPLLRLRWAWRVHQDTQVRTERGPQGAYEHVLFSERAELNGVGRSFFVEDVFGLCRIRFHHRDPNLVVRVLPHTGKLRRAEFLYSFAGGDEHPHPMGLVDGDLVELRRYVPGDPARSIHWKVFGRTRKLMVRTPERALSRARRTVAYLVSGDHDEASAAVARLALEENVLGEEWVFSADGAESSTDKLEVALEWIAKSAHARNAPAAGLQACLARAERQGPMRSILFVPATPGPWIETVLHVARTRKASLHVVIGVDGVQSPPSWWKRFWMLVPFENAAHKAELDSVVQAFHKAGVKTQIFDRITGAFWHKPTPQAKQPRAPLAWLFTNRKAGSVARG